jgi:hypothetical protein
MAEPRKRRIVRRAIWSGAIVLGLLSVYITSYGAANWMLAGRIIDQGTAFKIHGSIVFRPLHQYEATDLPGALGLTTISRWCIYRSQGSKMTWGQALKGAKHHREMWRTNERLRQEQEEQELRR